MNACKLINWHCGSMAEHVLADIDLAWVITRAMLPGLAAPHKCLQTTAACGCSKTVHRARNGGWPLAEWLALSSLNAAFLAALAPQPVSLRLSSKRAQNWCRAHLARLRPHLAVLELPPGDRDATSAVLSDEFRCGTAPPKEFCGLEMLSCPSTYAWRSMSKRGLAVCPCV